MYSLPVGKEETCLRRGVIGDCCRRMALPEGIAQEEDDVADDDEDDDEDDDDEEDDDCDD